MAYTRRLYKSSGDKMISGVSGGMAEYFGIDPVFVRLGWIVSVFLTGGISILIYIAMIFVVPKRAYNSTTTSDAGENGGQGAIESDETEGHRRERNRYFLGIGLILAGVALLIYNMNIYFLSTIDWGILGAVAVIGVGVALLAASIWKR
ncbi:MAG: PspC domain-containing protein [Dehalococcoidia bacterium]|nr:PspC domain-containing protein [Dehalococcoidia bacterium]